MKKLVLAYSGGLDTSYCVAYLTEQGYEVHALTVDTGGFDDAEIAEMEQRALSLGAKSYKRIDVTEAYYRDCLRYLVYGNCLRYQTYPMSVSAERMFQAITTAKYAVELGADGVAHGSTGAGNDQVRFDLAFELSGRELEIITPIRDLKLSRQAEVEYLAERGLQWPEKKGTYSINAGLWGTSVGGAETLTSDQPLPESAWPVQVRETEPRKFDLHFTEGQFTGFDDQVFDGPVAAIKALERLAAPFGVGRDVHVGDTIIGIKGRVGFAAAAAVLIIKAHHLLEKHTLAKWQLFWKEQLGNWYGMMLHEGQFLDPVMRDIEAFLESSQGTVNGTVHLTLHPHRFTLDGISSPDDLLGAGFGSYGEMNKGWTGDDVRGFTKILSVPGRIRNAVAGAKGVKG